MSAAVLACAVLAIPPATVVVRLLDAERLGLPGAHAVLWSIAALLTVAALAVPGPRWAGGLLLMLLTVAIFAGDMLFGSPLQVNAVFGHATILGGRFYGTSNAPFSVLLGASIMGGAALAEMLGHRRTPWWYIAGLVVGVVLIGLPVLGANFGGLITGVATVPVVAILGRQRRVSWKALVASAVAALAVAGIVTVVDLTRPLAEQTHLGRFAGSLAAGDLEAVISIVQRKAAQSLSTLEYSPWTFGIPVILVAFAVLLWRPRGLLADVLARHPLLPAALWGMLLAGVVGFAANDSGIVVPAVLAAYAVPMLGLLEADAVAPRKP
jgi:hypothetical protein